MPSGNATDPALRPLRPPRARRSSSTQLVAVAGFSLGVLTNHFRGRDGRDGRHNPRRPPGRPIASAAPYRIRRTPPIARLVEELPLITYIDSPLQPRRVGGTTSAPQIYDILGYTVEGVADRPELLRRPPASGRSESALRRNGSERLARAASRLELEYRFMARDRRHRLAPRQLHDRPRRGREGRGTPRDSRVRHPPQPRHPSSTARSCCGRHSSRTIAFASSTA